MAAKRGLAGQQRRRKLREAAKKVRAKVGDEPKRSASRRRLSFRTKAAASLRESVSSRGLTRVVSAALKAATLDEPDGTDRVEASVGLAQNESTHLRVSCYTYGSCAVGSAGFANEFNRRVPDTWRFVNGCDAIVFVSQRFGYQQVGRYVYMNEYGIIVDANRKGTMDKVDNGQLIWSMADHSLDFAYASPQARALHTLAPFHPPAAFHPQPALSRLQPALPRLQPAPSLPQPAPSRSQHVPSLPQSEPLRGEQPPPRSPLFPAQVLVAAQIMGGARRDVGRRHAAGDLGVARLHGL